MQFIHKPGRNIYRQCPIINNRISVRQKVRLRFQIHNRPCLFLPIIFLIILLCNSAAGQSCVCSTGSASLNITATVLNISPVQLTTLHDMYIDRDLNNDREIYISPLTGINAGLMRADGIPDAQVRMTYLMNEVLREESGNGKISIHYEMSGNDEWVQEASEIIDTGEAVFNLGDDGSYYLWIGGFVNIADAGPGKYNGQFIIEIEYL